MKWLFLLRAFFPSWRFFDDVGPELRLEVRAGFAAENLGEWRNALPAIRRSVKNFPLNPQGNFLHAAHNLLNHLNGDIQEYEDISRRPAFRIVRNLAREAAGAPYYQFRLTAIGVDQVLLSPVYAR